MHPAAQPQVRNSLIAVSALLPEDKKQLNDLIVKFRADKDESDRVKRLRELAGVADISVSEADEVKADAAAGGHGFAQAAAATRDPKVVVRGPKWPPGRVPVDPS